MQSKRCTKCGEVKPVSGFRRDRSKRDGRQALCKKCRCDYDRAYDEDRQEERRAYNEAHREERLAYQRAYREARREEIIDRQRDYRESHRNEIRDRDRDYREAHREEILAAKSKKKTEVRKASLEVATRNGEPWTPAEDHVVLTSEGTALDIAIELGRTIDSVHNRRALLRRKAVTA